MKKDNNIIQTIDIVDAMAEMTSAEIFCFKTIYDKVKKSIRYTEDCGRYKCKFDYIVKISIKDKQNQKKFLSGFKSLESKDIIRRIKRGYYMISPYMLIDSNGVQEYNEKIWNDAK